jgi:hypothetical protein
MTSPNTSKEDPKTQSMFYNKEESAVLSNNNESDFEDVVQEVSLKQKAKKPVESDDETLIISSKPPRSK